MSAPHNTPGRYAPTVAAIKNVRVVNDYEEMDKEPHTPPPWKEAYGEPVAPPYVNKRAKVLKLLSDISNMKF